MSYMDFNPYLYQERRQQMLREVDSSGSSRFLGFVRRSALPIARQAGLTK